MKKLFLTTVISLVFFSLSVAQHEVEKEGKKIPNIEIRDLEGNIFNTSDIQNDGAPIILDFWSTTCKPCIKELIALDENYEDWQEETGVKIFIISVDNSRSTNNVAPFVNGKGWEFETYLDSNSDFKRAMGVIDIPHTFIIDGEEKVKDAVRSAINNITDVLRVVEELSKQIIDQIVEWVGFVVGVHSIPLSIFLHRYYSKYMLQGFRDDLFMELGDILDFMGIEKPRNPGFDFPISITFEVADSPPWWPDIWVWEGWTKEFIDERISLELPLDILWELPIPIGIIDPLSLIITGVGENLEKKPDLQMLLFINNVAAQTFDENRIDPVKVSYENDNCFMMASTYRMFSSKFLGQHNHDNRRKFVSVMANLDSAPSDFPNNQSESSPWHQNFRWMRGADNSPDGRKIYGGMDFMLPLILSASQVKDIHFNRAMLLEALAPIIIEDENMGPFKLPFQGPYTGEKSIFSPKAGGTQSDTIIYIGVVFDRGRGVGELKINYNDLGGNKQTESFSPNDPSKMIAVPLNDRAVTAELTSDLKGYFLIQSSA